MNVERIWNLIVKHYQTNYNAPEEKLQKDWENKLISGSLGYMEWFGEIDAHRTIHLGSTKRVIPDIIIKNDERDLFDIELKQYSLPFTIEMEKQLKSYMDLLHVSVGVLVCQKIYVYVYDFSKSKLKKVEISFIEDNPDGIAFVELFSKGNFSEEKVENFIDSKNNFDSNVQKIKSEITQENVVALMKSHFLSIYSAEEVEIAMKDVVVAIGRTNSIPMTSHSPAIKKEDNFDVSPKVGLLDPMEYEEPNFDYVIIKTTESKIIERGSLYEATRYKWKAGDRIARYSFVLSVVNTYVREVYIVERWKKEGERWWFEGHKAEGEIYENLIGKRIPYKYRKKGMASPYVYKQ